MKLALIGFGVVGQGLARILQNKGAEYRREFAFDPKIVAISDSYKGSLYHPDGLHLDTLLQVVEQTGKVDGYPDAPGLVRGLDSLQTIQKTNADVIVEASFTNIQTGEPAITHCRAAFEAGKHVVTTNKGPVALAYNELMTLARQSSVSLGYEGTVMSGTPSLWMRQALQGCTIYEVRGIFNGTTNYILTEMEGGRSYADALAEAQRLGYAEADPTADVEGWDTLGKVLILSNVVMGVPLSTEHVPTRGISQLTPDDVARAAQVGQRWKLIGSVRRDANGITASVQPVALSMADPLANVRGVTNAITYVTDLLGEITLVGPGAGQLPTGFALLSDLLGIHRTYK